MSVTSILFCVSVPVLSEQTTFTHPSVSTIGSFFTITRFFAILITPNASVTVTTMGRPSGIAATAKLLVYGASVQKIQCTEREVTEKKVIVFSAFFLQVYAEQSSL